MKLRLLVYGTMAVLVLSLAVVPRFTDNDLIFVAALIVFVLLFGMATRRIRCKYCNWPVMRLKLNLIGLPVWAFWIPGKCRDCGRKLE